MKMVSRRTFTAGAFDDVGKTEGEGQGRDERLTSGRGGCRALSPRVCSHAVLQVDAAMIGSFTIDPKDVALLVGAGVSVDTPSCIPAAAVIVGALSDWLGDGDPEQADRARRAMMARGNNPYAFVRFEQVWQTLDSLMPGVSRALESLELFGGPNENHDALAEVLANGGSVITTNFDRRVEWALRRRGTRSAPWVFGRSKARPEDDTRYFKVHGSFGRRRQLLATLFSIGSAGLSFSRMSPLREALAARVEGCTPVVAGYSFSDHFDLVPLIENEWRPSRIILIEYQPGAEGSVSALEDAEESILPDAALPFPVGALARARARLPDTPIRVIRHVAVWKVLKALGLCTTTDAAQDGKAEDLAALNRASFEDALDDAAWTPTQKRLAIQMLEKQDGFGFHASLDTGHDNDWTVLEREDEPEQPPDDPGEAVYEQVAGFIRDKRIAEAALFLAQARNADLEGSRAVLLARAVVARVQGNLREGWRLQLQYVDECNVSDPSFWCRHRHEIENAELYASVALDYLEHARLLGDDGFAAELIEGLHGLFDQSGLIWVAVEVGLAESRLARQALNSAASAGFGRAAGLAENAAYYAWRSGRWDLAKRAVNEFTWYLMLAGKSHASIQMLDRLRAVCPEDDHAGWVALTANITISAALYVDPKLARAELNTMSQRVDRDDKDLWLHVVVCEAACELADGGRDAGLRSLAHAQQTLDALGTDHGGHQTCIDAIKRRFGVPAP